MGASHHFFEEWIFSGGGPMVPVWSQELKMGWEIRILSRTDLVAKCSLGMSREVMSEGTPRLAPVRINVRVEDANAAWAGGG